MNLSATLASGLFGYSASSAQAGDAASAIAMLSRVTRAGAETKAVAHQQKDPVTLTAITQFKTALAKAKDLKSALADPRVLNVLLPALGLADQTGFPGLAQRALMSDPKDKKSVAVAMGTTWTNAAKTLDLKNKGLAGLQDPAVISNIVSQFVGYEYHAGLDNQQPGMSDALYFLDNAASVAKGGNIYHILGDGIVRRVVTTALGLPPQLAIQPIETQAAAIKSKMNLADLTDPAKIQKMAQRYLMEKANAAQASGGNTSQLLSLFA